MKWPWVRRSRLLKEYERGKKEARHGYMGFKVPAPVEVHIMIMDDGRPGLVDYVHLGDKDELSITHQMAWSNYIVVDTFPGSLQRAQEFIARKRNEPKLEPDYFFPSETSD